MPKKKQWEFPASTQDRIAAIAKESARMSYPSSMSRGSGQVVNAGTKKVAESFFCESRDIQDVIAGRVATHRFDRWHALVCGKLAAAIQEKVCGGREPIAVCTKFLDTFMHQLMKYEESRPLWPVLHLPLDRLVFEQLRKVYSPALKPLAALLDRSPYTLKYAEHMQVQRALSHWLSELNGRKNMEFTLRSRVELNWMWALARR
jgi:hypothetical protein